MTSEAIGKEEEGDDETKVEPSRRRADGKLAVEPDSEHRQSIILIIIIISSSSRCPLTVPSQSILSSSCDCWEYSNSGALTPAQFEKEGRMGAEGNPDFGGEGFSEEPDAEKEPSPHGAATWELEPEEEQQPRKREALEAELQPHTSQ